jgi:hypothetical protein
LVLISLFFRFEDSDSTICIHSLSDLVKDVTVPFAPVKLEWNIDREKDYFADPDRILFAHELIEMLSVQTSSKDLFFAITERHKTGDPQEFDHLSTALLNLCDFAMKQSLALLKNMNKEMVISAQNPPVPMLAPLSNSVMVSPQVPAPNRIGYRPSALLNCYFCPLLITKGQRLSTRLTAFSAVDCNLHTLDEPVPCTVSFDNQSMTIRTPRKDLVIEESDLYFLCMEPENQWIEFFFFDGHCRLLTNILNSCLYETVSRTFPKQKLTREAVEKKIQSMTSRCSKFEFLSKINIFFHRLPHDNMFFPIMPALISAWDSFEQDRCYREGFRDKFADSATFPINPALQPGYPDQQKSFARRHRHCNLLTFESFTDSAPPRTAVSRNCHTLKKVIHARESIPMTWLASFESIGDDEELPKFATDRFDFVYKMRKLLESSLHLEQWVFLNFDLKISIQRPARQKPTAMPGLVPNGQFVKFAHPLPKCEGFGIVTTENYLYFGDTVVGNFSGFQAAPMAGGFVFYSSQAHYMDLQTVSQQQILVSSICLEKLIVGRDGLSFLYVYSPSMIYKGSFNEHKPHVLFYETKANVLGMKISVRLNIAVISCEDWKVRIRCLSNGKKVSTFDLENENATEIFITHEFGFVFIVTKTRLVLLSLNGLLIKTIWYQFPDVLTWFSFSPGNGIDYIGLITKEGGLRYFEAFYPERLVAVAAIPTAVAAGYDMQCTGFKVLTKTGQITFIEHDLFVMPIDEAQDNHGDS